MNSRKFFLAATLSLAAIAAAPELQAQITDQERAQSNYFQAEAALADRQLDRAEQYLEQAIALLGGSNAKLAALEVKILFARKRYVDARQALDRFFGFNPGPNLRRELAPIVLRLDAIADEEKRAAALSTIERARSDDPALDQYQFGFRLWEAGFYLEAQKELSSFIQNYPGHEHVTRSEYWLGRAYLDNKQPASAAPWLLRAYQATPKSEMTADSLLFLARAMLELKEVRRACIALDEFDTVLAGDANERLKNDYEVLKSKANCVTE